MSSEKRRDDVRRRVEAALLSSGRPVSSEELMRILRIRKSELLEAIRTIKSSYDSCGSALELLELDDSFMIRIRPELAGPARKFSGRPFLSRSMAKTLSYIAFYGPVEAKDLASKRGIVVYSQLKALERMGLVRRVERDGRRMYEVTESFYRLFNEEELKEKLRGTSPQQ